MSRRIRLFVLIAVVLLVALVLVGRRLNATKIGGQGRAEPFRIAGNLYYVGATDATSFLITGPEGHIVIDAGYPTTAALVMESIAKLGFNVSDVKILLNSEPHPDHAGGLGVLKRASGAALYASDASAYSLETGGDDPVMLLPLRVLLRLGVVGYPAMHVDHRIKDGDVVRLGPLAITAHITGGHSRGCTSWTFTVQDGTRPLNVVSACDLGRLETGTYPEQQADLARSIQTLRGLPADIWVTCHARWWGRYRKYVASQTSPNPADAFIDPDGYRVYLDTAEEELRNDRLH